MQSEVTNPAVFKVVSCTEAQMCPGLGDMLSLISHNKPRCLPCGSGEGKGARSPAPTCWERRSRRSCKALSIS